MKYGMFSFGSARILAALYCSCSLLASLLMLAQPAAADDDAHKPIDGLKSEFRRPPEIPFPKDDPFRPEAALLGRTLFFDARLSGSGSLSCASCHNPSYGWEDGLRISHGDGMKDLIRHTPTILNTAWGRSFFWDGRAPTLEEQAKGPLFSTKEMNQNMDLLPGKLAAVAGYKPMFDRAFPGQGITISTIVRAIAMFERTVASARTPFDDWIDGDENAISASAKNGFALFTGKANCASCHSGWTFSDEQYHDIGLPGSDKGRADIAPAEDYALYAFKTPTLRDVARRAPYMHDGSLKDLNAVLAHYRRGFIQRKTLSPLLRPIDITDDEARDIIAFLNSLSEPPRSFPAPTLPQ